MFVCPHRKDCRLLESAWKYVCKAPLSWNINFGSLSTLENNLRVYVAIYGSMCGRKQGIPGAWGSSSKRQPSFKNNQKQLSLL